MRVEFPVREVAFPFLLKPHVLDGSSVYVEGLPMFKKTVVRIIELKGPCGINLDEGGVLL